MAQGTGSGRRRRLRAPVGGGVAAAVFTGVLLAGCGVGDAAHVIGPTGRTTTTAPVPPAAPGTTSTARSTPPVATTATTAAVPALPGPADVGEVERELQQLSASLQQADHDLGTTRGDS